MQREIFNFLVDKGLQGNPIAASWVLAQVGFPADTADTESGISNDDWLNTMHRLAYVTNIA